MEDLLYRCAVVLKRIEYDLFFTTDRMVLQPHSGPSRDAIIILLTSVQGHQTNKPKEGVENQKTLIKLMLASDEGMIDRVLDFSGESRFSDQKKIDALLKEHSGDAAASRQLRVKEEQDIVARKRAKFLLDRPALKALYDELVGSVLTGDEFWNRYQQEVDCEIGESRTISDNVVPVPLRPPETGPTLAGGSSTVSSISGAVTVTAERARGIFSQYPQVKELYAACVPHALSEKDFWRRFFQCQFFWKSQGTDRETVRDPVFDPLSRVLTKPQTVPVGGLNINPCIDLSQDFLGEGNRDRSVTKELGGLILGDAIECLAKRFNDFGNEIVENVSSTAPSNSLEELEKIAEERTAALEKELDWGRLDTPQNLGTSTLPKLRASRVIDRKPVGDLWHKIHSDLKTLPPLVADMPGVLENTLAITETLVNQKPKNLSSSEPSKAVRVLATTKENGELEVLAERVNELLRHLWASHRSETERRHRIVTSLIKQRDELDLWLGKAGPQWSFAVKSILECIGQGERLAKLFK